MRLAIFALVVLAACAKGSDPVAQDPCNTPTPLTIGTTISGSLTESDCEPVSGGSFLDVFSFATTANTHVAFTMTSSTVDAFLALVHNASERATGDNTPGSADARVEALLKADTWELWANTAGPQQLGAYQLTSTALPEDVAGCAIVWVVSGITSTQTLPGTDCEAPDGSSRIGDNFPLTVSSGNNVTATMTAATFRAQVAIYANGSLVRINTADTTGVPTSVNYTVPFGAHGAIIIEFTSLSGADTSKAYTFNVVGGATSLVFGPRSSGRFPSLLGP